MARWSKGTNDHDGDGRKGGSLSVAEAQEREQKEQEMAKAKAPAAAAPEKEDTPAQPWAQPSESAAGDAPGDDDAGDNAGDENPPSDAGDAGDPTPALDTDGDLARSFEELTPEERDEFEAHMTAEARVMLEKLVRRRRAFAMEARMIDGTQHYGTRARNVAPVADQED